MNSEDQKLLAFLRRLFEKTKTKEVPWEAPDDTNIMVIAFPSFTVKLERVPPGEDGPEDFGLQISEGNGAVLLQVNSEEAKALEYPDLKEFFNAARRVALNFDDAVETLTEELEELLRRKR